MYLYVLLVYDNIMMTMDVHYSDIKWNLKVPLEYKNKLIVGIDFHILNIIDCIYRVCFSQK